jgi:hypothetical protein
VNALRPTTPRTPLRRLVAFLTGYGNQNWSRVVMVRAQQQLFEQVGAARMRTLEISGTNWQHYTFGSYRTVAHSDLDICTATLDETYELIIADQVWEHLLWPYRATRNVFAMLDPGGYFMISVPFLVRVHGYPVDCSRWTELGLKHLLAECGFPLDAIQTGAWGNRRSVKANFRWWWNYIPWLHSLGNEPNFPHVVWALARRPPDP